MVENSEDRIILEFQLKQNDSSSDVMSLSNSNESDKIVWDMPEINDFVRRLGFSDSGDENANMKSFIQLFEVYLPTSFIEFSMFFLQIVKKIQSMVESLHQMGHPDYSDVVFPYKIKCSTNISELKELVSCKILIIAND